MMAFCRWTCRANGQAIPSSIKLSAEPSSHVEFLRSPLVSMSHYSALVADRRTLPYLAEDRSYYSTSGRSAQWAPETSSSTSHYIPTPASLVSPWNAVNFTCQPEHNSRSASTSYPLSSHRTVSSPPCLLDAISVYVPPFTRPASCATVSDAYSAPYPDYNITSPESSASPPPAPVKEEQPDDDGFIMDLPFAPLSQTLAPPTEVPLRATQASPTMRRMMGVFRLNPFAMHAHGGRGILAPWAGGEARPLDEEPRIFEFQLELPPEEAPKMEPTFDTNGLRSFSPAFEPDAEQVFDQESESSWELGYPPLSAFDPVATYPRALHYSYYPDSRSLATPARRWSLPNELGYAM
ncbi:hypothetical protein C8F04DRAFT_1396904 [Mycena alexandri]|uniref:Uncharacterized protein n=1 Tax=Mycena alexandri TaxID=1745969 RepID=A0AAD6SUF5_9AGAR|nr:hypothetical protein C8F04DRAFT_1396904 [Mycena alexandri]